MGGDPACSLPLCTASRFEAIFLGGEQRQKMDAAEPVAACFPPPTNCLSRRGPHWSRGLPRSLPAPRPPPQDVISSPPFGSSMGFGSPFGASLGQQPAYTPAQAPALPSLVCADAFPLVYQPPPLPPPAPSFMGSTTFSSTHPAPGFTIPAAVRSPGPQGTANWFSTFPFFSPCPILPDYF